MKIMIVDDDPVTLMVVRAVLEDAGFEVQTRSEALGTTAAILQYQPDLVLLDVNMPGLSGDRLAVLIPDGTARKIVFHSAQSREALAQLVRQAGVLGAIPKSSDHAALLAEVRAMLARAQGGA
jgi:DNA-binding response OmpR family regulator